MKIVEVLARIDEAILNAINRGNELDAKNNPAEYLADSDGVPKSDKSFSDLSAESKRDRAE